MAFDKKAWLNQVKEDAERLTRRRFNEQLDDHQAKENEVNTREGVTVGTPVREAALVNPSEPDLENFSGEAESSLSGEKPKASKQANTPSVTVEGVEGESAASQVKSAKKESK